MVLQTCSTSEGFWLRVFDLYTFSIQTGEKICIGGLPEKFFVYKLYNFSIKTGVQHLGHFLMACSTILMPLCLKLLHNRKLYQWELFYPLAGKSRKTLMSQVTTFWPRSRPFCIQSIFFINLNCLHRIRVDYNSHPSESSFTSTGLVWNCRVAIKKLNWMKTMCRLTYRGHKME